MIKPDSLRAALTAAIADLERDPDRLAIFVDKGRLVSRLTPGLGFEWRYTIRLEFHDFTGSPDTIAVPLLLWLREHQPERFLEFAREDSAIGFAADIIDSTTWDVAIAFELSEAVELVAGSDEAGKPGWTVTHLAEPSVTDLLLDGADAAVGLGAIDPTLGA